MSSTDDTPRPDREHRMLTPIGRVRSHNPWVVGSNPARLRGLSRCARLVRCDFGSQRVLSPLLLSSNIRVILWGWRANSRAPIASVLSR